MPTKLTDEQIAAARLAIEAGLDALSVLDSGAVDAAALRAVDLPVVPVVAVSQPSADVQELIARSTTARRKYISQTDATKAAAIALQVLAAVGKLLPFASGFLRVVLIAAVAIAAGSTLLTAGGCGAPQVRADVQAPITVPVDLKAPVAVEAPISLPKVDVRAHVPVQASVGLLNARGGQHSTSQPAATEAEQRAGRDARQITTTVNLTGSAWAIIVLAGVLVFGLVVWARRRGRLAEARRNEGTSRLICNGALGAAHDTEQHLIAVARAIKEMGECDKRDELLSLVAAQVQGADRGRLNELLADRGVRVSRRRKAG